MTGGACRGGHIGSNGVQNAVGLLPFERNAEGVGQSLLQVTVDANIATVFFESLMACIWLMFFSRSRAAISQAMPRPTISSTFSVPGRTAIS